MLYLENRVKCTSNRTGYLMYACELDNCTIMPSHGTFHNRRTELTLLFMC